MKKTELQIRYCKRVELSPICSAFEDDTTGRIAYPTDGAKMSPVVKAFFQRSPSHRAPDSREDGSRR